VGRGTGQWGPFSRIACGDRPKSNWLGWGRWNGGAKAVQQRNTPNSEFVASGIRKEIFNWNISKLDKMIINKYNVNLSCFGFHRMIKNGNKFWFEECEYYGVNSTTKIWPPIPFLCPFAFALMSVNKVDMRELVMWVEGGGRTPLKSTPIPQYFPLLCLSLCLIQQSNKKKVVKINY
jgi:hypothetical protein